MTKRKFYKTTLQVTILSEEPFEWDDLSSVHHSVTSGDCSGDIEEIERITLNGKECASALIAQGSDPEFFQITEEGEDL
jgi:hypothetical protein